MEVTITSANIHAELVVPGLPPLPLPKGMRPIISLNQPSQLDPDIESIAMAFVRAAVPPGLQDADEVWRTLTPVGDRVRLFADALYAARYHQLQFLFRLKKVTSQQTFGFLAPVGNVRIRINDLPMRAELEGFLIRVRSSLDALARVLCLIGGWSDKHKSYGMMCAFVAGRSGQSDDRYRRLDRLLKAQDSWVTKTRALRDAIAHEGGSEEFVPVGHEGMLLLDAMVGGVRAGEFVISTWRQLRDFLRALPEVVPSRESKS